MSLMAFLCGVHPRTNPARELALRSRLDRIDPDSGIRAEWRLRVWVDGYPDSEAVVFFGPAMNLSLGTGELSEIAWTERDARPWAYLDIIEVDPPIRGQGLASRLLAAAVDGARAWGAEGITLEAAASGGRHALSQHDLIAFYQRHGFTFLTAEDSEYGLFRHLWMDLRPTPRRPCRHPGLPAMGNGTLVKMSVADRRKIARKMRGGLHQAGPTIGVVHT